MSETARVSVSTIIGSFMLTVAGTMSFIAAEEPKLPAGVTCEVVREMVSLHGRLAAHMRGPN